MPEISSFYGIRITIYFDEHPPMHFHAEYAEFEAVFDIGNGEVINGKLPKTATKLVKKWWKINKHLIRKAWNDIQNEAEFEKIPPLN